MLSVGELLMSIAKKHTLLVIDHDMTFVRQIAMKVTVLHEGEMLCQGTVQEVFTERFREVRRQLPGELSWSIELFTNFLFGLWLARSGKMENVSGNLGFSARCSPTGWWADSGYRC